MHVEYFEVIEDNVNGHYHAIPEGEADKHLISGRCHCYPVVEIHAERNGGNRIHRHRKILIALDQQIQAVQEAVKALSQELVSNEGD